MHIILAGVGGSSARSHSLSFLAPHAVVSAPKAHEQRGKLFKAAVETYRAETLSHSIFHGSEK